jgi:type I restriction-modification system DNA methylase subunit
MASKKDLSASITNKSGLKEKIHEIHNYIRNSGAGYGMNALKIFNLLYGLLRIEQFNLLDKFNLKRPECEFSYLYKLAISNETGKDDKIYELLTKDILDSINESSIRTILFYEIPKNITANVYTQLIIEIQSIANIENTCNVLLSGKIYEYFIGRDRTAISELGAYFTDRSITKFIFDKLKIEKSGSKIIDPFAGSGGFSTEYINYLNRINPDIDWSKEINNIYHYDINEDVIKSAGLELFCLSNGNIIPDTNLKVENSFKNEFSNKKFNYIITNPPYGGDKVIKTLEQIKRDKIKNYIKELLKTEKDKDVIIKRNKQIRLIDELNKQEKIRNDKLQVNKDNCSNRIRKFCKTYQIEAKDKEACSLVLLMDLIEIDGICCGVLKEGVFFDSKYSKLREVLINNYNVTDIISVPADSFENTTTKTSILIFKNTNEKTTEITFSELVVHKYKDDKFEEDEEGNIIISEYKDDIYDVENSIISTINIEEIKEKLYSLNHKDYDKKELICGDDFKIVKLGDICKIIKGIKRKSNLGKEYGLYPLYFCSIVRHLYLDTYDYDDTAIIINKTNGTGRSMVYLGKGKYNVGETTLHFKTDNEKLTLYIYYYLFNNIKLLETYYKGACQKSITENDLFNMKIPIPKTEEKLNEIVNRISTPFDRKINNDIQLLKLNIIIKNKIKYITENEDCEEVELGSVCEINQGTNLTKTNIINGIYNIIGGGNKVIGKYNEKNRNGNEIVFTRVGNLNISYHVKPYYLTDNAFSIKSNDIIINKFIYNYLNNNFDKIKNKFDGSVQKVISKTNLKNMKIKIPKDKSLITALEPLFKEIEDLEEFIENDDKLFKEYLEDLAKEAIVSYDIPANTDEIKYVNSNEDEEKELSEMTIQELKNKCKELGIKGYTKLKKEELIDIINKQ